MLEGALQVLTVAGSLRARSVTRPVVEEVGRMLQERGCGLDNLDLRHEPLPLYNPDTAYDTAEFAALKSRVERADVFLLGTPDYHGSISAPLKNFLDHFWTEFAGRLFGMVVASHEKGLTAIDQLRTVARQCYAWSLPYGVSLAEDQDVQDGVIVSDGLRKRLQMFARDLHVYGRLLAEQRKADLSSREPGFMAKHR